MLYALGETFNEPVSEVRAEAYIDALSDLPTDALITACKRAIRESKFFPRPAELRELVEGSAVDRAEIAWNAMRRMVRQIGYYATPADADWPDDATRRAALELYGGWAALCSRLPAEGPEMLGAAKLFKANYLAYVNRERVDQALPAASVSGYLHDGNE